MSTANKRGELSQVVMYEVFQSRIANLKKKLSKKRSADGTVSGSDPYEPFSR